MKLLLLLFLALVVGIFNTSAQVVSTNMPALSDAQTFINAGVSIGAVVITGSLGIALGWLMPSVIDALKIGGEDDGSVKDDLPH